MKIRRFLATALGLAFLVFPLATSYAPNDSASTTPELYSDLNNDGKVDSADAPLAGKPYVSGATDEEKDQGTEFMFANDDLSNGAWDKDDNVTANKPNTATDDDDVEEFHIVPGITDGEVWLDHQQIAGLKFYSEKSCTTEVHISPNQHRTVAPNSAFPGSGFNLFARAESVTFPLDQPQQVTKHNGSHETVNVGVRQVEGDLRLMVKRTGEAGAGIEGAKMKLTIVKGIGADKFYRAAIDYIYERNTRYYTRYITTGPDQAKSRCTVMLLSKTSLVGINAKPPAGVAMKSINAVITTAPWNSSTVVMNCSYNAGLGTDPGGDFFNLFRGTLWKGNPGSDGTCSIASPFDPGNGAGKPDCRGYVASGPNGRIVFDYGEIPTDLLPNGQPPRQGSAGMFNGGPTEYGCNGSSEEWTCLAYVTMGNEELIVTAVADAAANYTGVQFAMDLIRPQNVPNIIYWPDPNASFCYALATPTPGGVLTKIAAGLRHGWLGPFRNECIKPYLGFTASTPR